MDIAATIVKLLGQRAVTASICPSDVARALADDEPRWRALMPAVREAAAALAREHRIVITQGDHRLDPADVDSTKPSMPSAPCRFNATACRPASRPAWSALLSGGVVRVVYEAMPPGSPQMTREEQIEALTREIGLLKADAGMLKTFHANGDVTHKGILYKCRIPDPRGGAGQFVWRRVTLVPDQHQPMAFIQMDPHPNSGNSDRLVRVRPGWEELKESLTSKWAHKWGFDVYVCTAASPGWATEVWRLLDPTHAIFPASERARRIVCVPTLANVDTCKYLARSVRVSHLVLFPRDGLDMPSFPVPLTVVVDDRLSVWDPEGKSCLLQIIAAHPVAEAAMKGMRFADPCMNKCVAEVKGTHELGRIQKGLVQLLTDSAEDAGRLTSILGCAIDVNTGLRHASGGGTCHS
ncbi:MAG: hypothetical protein WDW38_002026 [Sanguina aurantia]